MTGERYDRLPSVHSSLCRVLTWCSRALPFAFAFAANNKETLRTLLDQGLDDGQVLDPKEEVLGTSVQKRKGESRGYEHKVMRDGKWEGTIVIFDMYKNKLAKNVDGRLLEVVETGLVDGVLQDGKVLRRCCVDCSLAASELFDVNATNRDRNGVWKAHARAHAERAQLAQRAAQEVEQQVVAPIVAPIVAPMEQQVMAPVAQQVVAPMEQQVMAPVAQQVVAPMAHEAQQTTPKEWSQPADWPGSAAPWKSAFSLWNPPPLLASYSSIHCALHIVIRFMSTQMS